MLDTTQETPRLNLRICGNRSSIVDMDAVRRVPTPQATNRMEANSTLKSCGCYSQQS